MSAPENPSIHAFLESIRKALNGQDHHLGGYIDDFNQERKPRSRHYERGDLPELRPYIETQRQFLEYFFKKNQRYLTNSVAYVAYYSELYFRLAALFELTLLREKQKIQKWKRLGDDNTKIIEMH